MKKLILIALLSFTILSCTKEESKIDNQTRIKNDIPEEMMGKWKIISDEGGGWNPNLLIYETYSAPYDTGKEYDLWIKEYSICCINEEEGCDEIWYSDGFVEKKGDGSFSTITCDGEKSFYYFYLFDPKEQDIVLIAESYGAGWSGYKYQKVE